MYVLNEQVQGKGCREERPGPSSQQGVGPPLNSEGHSHVKQDQSLSENENSPIDKLEE